MQEEENGKQSFRHTYHINGTTFHVIGHFTEACEIGRLITEIAIRQATEAVLLQDKTAEPFRLPVSK